MKLKRLIAAAAAAAMVMSVLAGCGNTAESEKTESTESSGIGIINMKKRVRMLGGTMQIQKENGFRIFITVPKK